MLIEFDTDKRQRTLEERGLDFCDAPKLFKGIHFIAQSEKMDYGEPRYFSIGCMGDRHVVVVWTVRGNARRIISMRYAHEREISRYKEHLG